MPPGNDPFAAYGGAAIETPPPAADPFAAYGGAALTTSQASADTGAQPRNNAPLRPGESLYKRYAPPQSGEAVLKHTLPIAGAIVGGGAGGPFAPETSAIGSGAGTTAAEMLSGTPAGDAAWEGVKNAVYTETFGRALSLAKYFGAPVLQKIADVLDDYELRMPDKPLKLADWIQKKPAGMSGSPSAEDLARARFQNVGYKPSSALVPKAPVAPPSMTPFGATPTNALPSSVPMELPAPGSVPQPQLAPPPTPKPNLIPFGGTPTNAPSSFQGELPPVPTENPSQAIQAIPKAAQEPMTKGRVLFVPMKSPGAAPESAKPGDLWTIPRDKLIDLAKAGDSNAVAILQRLGHKVVYVPNPAE